jgi:hypothetical protein
MIPLAALAKARALFTALGVGGTAAVILAFAIWGPPVSAPALGQVWAGGYAPRLSSARVERDAAIAERDAARRAAVTQAEAVNECEARRETEAGACAASLDRVSADLRARLARCESRQARFDEAFAPDQGAPDAPDSCLPRRIVPAGRVLQRP